MHSSRMRTARSFTVMRGVSERPPWTEIHQTETPSGQRPPCGQTDTFENITLSQTSFMGGNKSYAINFRSEIQNHVSRHTQLQDHCILACQNCQTLAKELRGVVSIRHQTYSSMKKKLDILNCHVGYYPNTNG